MQIEGDRLVRYQEEETLDLVIDQPVQVIGERAFANENRIRKVVLPPTVRVIEWEAFAHCPNLEEVILPEGIEEIRVGAFRGCAKLRKCNLPESLNVIEAVAFSGTSLEEILVPHGLRATDSTCMTGAFNVEGDCLRRFVWPYGRLFNQDRQDALLLCFALKGTDPFFLEADQLPVEQLERAQQLPAVRSIVQRSREGKALPDGKEREAQDWLLKNRIAWCLWDEDWDLRFFQYLIDKRAIGLPLAVELLSKAFYCDWDTIEKQMLEYIEGQDWDLSDGQDGKLSHAWNTCLKWKAKQDLAFLRWRMRKRAEEQKAEGQEDRGHREGDYQTNGGSEPYADCRG